MNGALDILFLVPEIFHAQFPVSVESVATRVKFSRGFAGSSVERVSASGLRPTPTHPPARAGRWNFWYPVQLYILKTLKRNDRKFNFLYRRFCSSFSFFGLCFLVFLLKQKISINIMCMQLISIITILLWISILDLWYNATVCNPKMREIWWKLCDWKE